MSSRSAASSHRESSSMDDQTRVALSAGSKHRPEEQSPRTAPPKRPRLSSPSPRAAMSAPASRSTLSVDDGGLDDDRPSDSFGLGLPKGMQRRPLSAPSSSSAPSAAAVAPLTFSPPRSPAKPSAAVQSSQLSSAVSASNRSNSSSSPSSSSSSGAAPMDVDQSGADGDAATPASGAASRLTKQTFTAKLPAAASKSKSKAQPASGLKQHSQKAAGKQQQQSSSAAPKQQSQPTKQTKRVSQKPQSKQTASPTDAKEAPAANAKVQSKPKAKKISKTKLKAKPKRSSAPAASEAESQESLPSAAVDANGGDQTDVSASLLDDIETASADVAASAQGESKADEEPPPEQQNERMQTDAAAAESSISLPPGLSVLQSHARRLQLPESAASEQEYMALIDSAIDFSAPAAGTAAPAVHDMALDKRKDSQSSQQQQQQQPPAQLKKPRKKAELEREQRDDVFHALLNIWTIPKAAGAEDSQSTASVKQLQARYKAFVGKTQAARDVQHLATISAQWASKILAEMVMARGCELDDCAFHAAVRKSKAASAAGDADAVLQHFDMSERPAFSPAGTQKSQVAIKAQRLRHDAQEEALKTLEKFFPAVCPLECQRQHVVEECKLRVHVARTQTEAEVSSKQKLQAEVDAALPLLVTAVQDGTVKLQLGDAVQAISQHLKRKDLKRIQTAVRGAHFWLPQKFQSKQISGFRLADNSEHAPAPAAAILPPPSAAAAAEEQPAAASAAEPRDDSAHASSAASRSDSATLLCAAISDAIALQSMRVQVLNKKRTEALARRHALRDELSAAEASLASLDSEHRAALDLIGKYREFAAASASAS